MLLSTTGGIDVGYDVLVILQDTSSLDANGAYTAFVNNLNQSIASGQLVQSLKASNKVFANVSTLASSLRVSNMTVSKVHYGNIVSSNNDTPVTSRVDFIAGVTIGAFVFALLLLILFSSRCQRFRGGARRPSRELKVVPFAEQYSDVEHMNHLSSPKDAALKMWVNPVDFPKQQSPSKHAIEGNDGNGGVVIVDNNRLTIPQQRAPVQI